MNSATEKMNSLAENAKQIAKNAEKKFEEDSEHVEDLTYQVMDLSSEITLARVSKIAAESRRICDELYSTYQSQVQMLDVACRPLLSESPDESAIGNIAKVIKWLNKESEIENNFSSSFNGIDLGTIIKAKYLPSMENQMIQKFWEASFLMTETGKNEAHEEEEHKERLKHLQHAFQDEVSTYETAIHVYQRECRKREKLIEETKLMIEHKVEDRLQKDRGILEDKENRRFQPVKSGIQKKIDDTDVKTRELEQRLSKLGIFKGREKKEVKMAIQQNQEERNKISIELSSEEKKHQKIMADIRNQVKPDESLRIRLQTENPEPPMPVEPAFPVFEYIVEKYGNQGDISYKRCAISEIICMMMESEDRFTVDDVVKDNVIFTNITKQTVSACLRRLVEQGRAVRTEERGKPYYTIIDR